MYHKIYLGIALMLALVGGCLLNTRSSFAAPEDTTYQEMDAAVQMDYWYNYTDDRYNGGASRIGDTPGEKAKFIFTGTSITWVTHEGPRDGSAKVMIDGKSKGIFNLYALTDKYLHRIKFSGLSNGKHSIVIKVLGKGGPVSSFQEVSLDAFIVSGIKTQETSDAILYGTWKAKHNTNASGGTFRVSGKKDETATFSASSSTVEWITATGPSYGKAEVILNGVSQGVVDLYSATPQWQVSKVYQHSGPSASYLVIRVLGEKNPTSTGTKVVVDAFGD